MDNLSYFILVKTLRYLDFWRDQEKITNLTNKLNDKLRYIYKNYGLNFRDYVLKSKGVKYYMNIHKILERYRIKTLYSPRKFKLTNNESKKIKHNVF